MGLTSWRYSSRKINKQNFAAQIQHSPPERPDSHLLAPVKLVVHSQLLALAMFSSRKLALGVYGLKQMVLTHGWNTCLNADSKSLKGKCHLLAAIGVVMYFIIAVHKLPS
jgi:hypothetical protein